MQIAARKTEVELNITAEKYRSVADRGSLLFFLMNELHRVHTCVTRPIHTQASQDMLCLLCRYYIFSLSAFVSIFVRAIDRVTTTTTEEPGSKEGGEDGKGIDPAAQRAVVVLSDADVAKRCQTIVDSITITTFLYLRRGTFERDKLTIAAQLCLKVMVRAKTLDSDLVQLLVIGPSVSLDAAGGMGALAEWMPPYLWPRVKGLEVVKPELAKIGDEMQGAAEAWRKWFDEEKPETIPCPGV